MKMNVGDGGDGAMGSLVELLFWIFGVGEGEGGVCGVENKGKD